MAAGVIAEISKHADVFEQFKKNPFDALKKLEELSGSSFGNVNVDDVEVLRSLTFEECQLLSSISQKVRKGGKSFKI